MSLSTQVLDIARGLPAPDLDVTLVAIDGAQETELARSRTDNDGRIAAPFGGVLEAGTYELRFRVGEYLRQTTTPSFYDEIPIRFKIHDPSANYHVPLLLTPWGYSTYRGS
jgi:5-hydroxyisourate hydrolase